MKDKSHQDERAVFNPSAGDGTSTSGSLFKNRKYLFLMSAQAVSNLGDWLYLLALFVLVGFKVPP